MSRAVLFISKRLGLRCASLIHELAPETLAAIVTIDDRGDVRSALDEIVAFAQHSAVPVHVAADAAEAASLLTRYRPDVVFCVSWYWFVRTETLASVPLGFIGIHFSLLPRYRGGSPLVWTIINGESTGGVSLFSLAPKMDTGDVWDQRPFAIPADATIGDVLPIAEETALEMLRDDYRAILSGTLHPKPQAGDANVVPMRKPEDGEVDWEQPARRVFDFVRAQSHPYPGAFTVVEGRRVRLWRAHFGGPSDGNPGEIVRAGDRPAIVCGDGNSIVIDEADGELPTGAVAGAKVKR